MDSRSETCRDGGLPEGCRQGRWVRLRLRMASLGMGGADGLQVPRSHEGWEGETGIDGHYHRLSFWVLGDVSRLAGRSLGEWAGFGSARRYTR